MFCSSKSQFRAIKKNGSSHWEISVSRTSQEYDKVTTPCWPCYYPLFAPSCQVVAYWKLKAKENFKLLALKVVAVTYERWLLTRDSKYSDLTWKLLVFWKTGRWGEVVATRGLTVKWNYAINSVTKWDINENNNIIKDEGLNQKSETIYIKK